MQLIWCDLETTGLDPQKNSILEVAMLTAELVDPFNVRMLHLSTIYMQPAETRSLDQFIIDMHTKNGLLRECENPVRSRNIRDVEEELLRLVPVVDDKADRPVLAGSTVHFDHSFIRSWIPRLAARLSYRNYDVSTLKLECQSQGMAPFPKAEAHRALDDVYESIAHAKACREWLRDHHRDIGFDEQDEEERRDAIWASSGN